MRMIDEGLPSESISTINTIATFYKHFEVGRLLLGQGNGCLLAQQSHPLTRYSFIHVFKGAVSQKMQALWRISEISVPVQACNMHSMGLCVQWNANLTSTARSSDFHVIEIKPQHGNFVACDVHPVQGMCRQRSLTQKDWGRSVLCSPSLAAPIIEVVRAKGALGIRRGEGFRSLHAPDDNSGILRASQFQIWSRGRGCAVF